MSIQQNQNNNQQNNNNQKEKIMPSNNTKTLQNKSAYFVMLAFLVLQMLILSDCYASTGTAMAAPLTAVENLIKGDLAKIIAIVSFAFGVLGSVVRFNVAAIASAFGVSIAAGAGPTLVTTLVTATF